MHRYGADHIKQEYEYHDYPTRRTAPPNSTGSSSACSTTSSQGSQQHQRQNQLASRYGDEETDCNLNIHPIQQQYLGFTVFEALRTVGVCVIDNFLKENVAKQLHDMLESLSSFQGLLHDPLLNVPQASTNRTSRFRDDYITWLSGHETGYQCVKMFNECLHKVIKLFYRHSLTQNQKFQITSRSSVQASCFPPQSMGYRLHSDNPNGNGRLLTLVYHCNEGYNFQTDGGTTRFFVNDKFADVHPKYNRLVIYWSTTMLEILPCNNKLYSLSSWYFGSLIAPVTAAS